MPGGLLLWSTQLVKVRLGGLCFFCVGINLALRSREIPSTGWSRKCCWRTGFSIFRFQISSAFKLVQSSNSYFHNRKELAKHLQRSIRALQDSSILLGIAAQLWKKSFRYNLKWKLLNEMDLFFVVVYQGILQIAYLEAAESDSSLYVLMFFPMFLEHYAPRFSVNFHLNWRRF